MTKFVVVLAVVIVVILVVVIVAVRNMRAEDPDEFADRHGGRGRIRDDRDGRDPRYDRRGSAARHPSRAGRTAGRQAANGARPAAAAGGYDERRDHRDRGYDQRPPAGRDYDDEAGFDSRADRGHEGRRGARPAASAGHRASSGAGRRPEEGLPPAARTRPARGRRSDDSSEWDSSEWEKLSDVDYWAELASNKPLTTTAPPPAATSAAATRRAPARNGRPDREAEGPAGRSPGPAGSVPRDVPRRDPATGLPVRDHPQPVDALTAVASRADFIPAPVTGAAATEQLRSLAEPSLSQPRHGGPASLPGPVRSLPPDRPPAIPDDDPLTSPSFPRVPASDSRSYRSSRASAPDDRSRAADSYLAPTQQFESYGSPAAPSRPAPRHLAAADSDRTSLNSYQYDPLLSPDPYPAPAPAASAPAGPPAFGNPYGSYVTPDRPAAAPGYGDYPPAPSNGHGSYPPPAAPAGNNYWQQPSPSTPGPGPGPGYLKGAAHADPRDAAGGADYQNGYGLPDQAPYPPNGYPARSHDPAGNAGSDPYGHDRYGGYSGYVPPGR